MKPYDQNAHGADSCRPEEFRRGFTLVELMISIAVISILAGLAAQTFSVVLDTRQIALNRIEMNETARAALEFLGTEISSAYLTPDSVKPVAQGLNNNTNTLERLPRFRFAGIYRDIKVSDDPYNKEVPGAGEDDDGDGKIDEEILDGLSGDYNNNFSGVPDTTECPPGSNDCIDEDIGLFPSDMLHFVSAVENEGDVMLQEISYGLDVSGTRLFRRSKVLNLSAASADALELSTFGQFIDRNTTKRLLPSPVQVGRSVNPGELTAIFTNWELGCRQGNLTQNSPSNNDPNDDFGILAYDIRGLRITYWYYDYNRGGWRHTDEWDSARETALMSPGEKIFTTFARNYSREGRNLMGIENIIVNEPDDMYPKAPPQVPGFGTPFLVTNPQQLVTALNDSNQPDYNTAVRIAQRTDGLPNMVEITVYVQDRERSIHPKPYTTRVFIPNNYRSLGS